MRNWVPTTLQHAIDSLDGAGITAEVNHFRSLDAVHCWIQ